MIENSKGYKTFLVFDYFMVALLALICLLPMIHILAVSLSDRVANTAGMSRSGRSTSIWNPTGIS